MAFNVVLISNGQSIGQLANVVRLRRDQEEKQSIKDAETGLSPLYRYILASAVVATSFKSRIKEVLPDKQPQHRYKCGLASCTGPS